LCEQAGKPHPMATQPTRVIDSIHSIHSLKNSSDVIMHFKTLEEKKRKNTSGDPNQKTFVCVMRKEPPFTIDR
jgi:hypothetical protein